MEEAKYNLHTLLKTIRDCLTRQIGLQIASLHSDKVRFLLTFLQPFPSFATSIFLKYKDGIVKDTVPTFIPFLGGIQVVSAPTCIGSGSLGILCQYLGPTSQVARRDTSSASSDL